ncbi:sugar ABC transporter permease [Marinithermofilum abyssi]|uniref:Sugar ABC transporter permease n=1 Tax=Marinithermofilum abyssi TaxID=1571185 RepID=A0A8J2VHG5_9BACL|nr:carbohydrate ABC transporter permease [Marinithermofilum abyssi]GGE15709.1 sugar ABC transporter permease [Marinithermofilum abyssi]
MSRKGGLRLNRSTFNRVVPYVILSLIGVMFLMPLLWVLFAAVDPQAQLSLKVPRGVTLDNFQAILTDPATQMSFVNGLFLSVGQSVLVVIVAGLAAYPLSRYQLNYKKPFMYTILFATALPITAVMVPVYQLFILLNFVDSLVMTMLFLTASSLPYAIWIMKNFMDSVPVELEEAAWVDGASVWRGLRSVIIPLMLPGVFTVSIFTFTSSWGNFFVPFILIQSPDKLPASVTIYQFFGQYGLVEYGKLAAFSILYAIPAVIMYIIGQRYMSQGFNFGGATKG